MRTDNGFVVLLAWLMVMTLAFSVIGSFMNDNNLIYTGAISLIGSIITFFVALTSIWKQQHPEDEKEEE